MKILSLLFSLAISLLASSGGEVNSHIVAIRPAMREYVEQLKAGGKYAVYGDDWTYLRLHGEEMANRAMQASEINLNQVGPWAAQVFAAAYYKSAIESAVMMRSKDQKEAEVLVQERNLLLLRNDSLESELKAVKKRYAQLEEETSSMLSANDKLVESYKQTEAETRHKADRARFGRELIVTLGVCAVGVLILLLIISAIRGLKLRDNP